jgi:modulator of FtsH protease HflK
LLRKGPFGPKLPQVSGGANWVGLGLGALALLWLATTSFHVLESHEEGVVSTLGSYSRTVGPGFNITLPFPIQTMTKVPARRAQTENIPEGNAQNFVLTGDANIINLTYSVRWTIKDPEQYLYQLDDPRATIRDAAESAMRATIANFQLETAITSGKSDIEDQVKTRLQAILDGYRSGIRIEGVAVRDAVAPTEVAAAFERVNVARQRSQTYINQARAYRAEIVQRAEGEAQAFDALYEQYRQSPGVTRRRIYYETMERVLRRAEKTVVDSRGVTSVLPLPEARRTAPPPPPAAAAPARGGQ